LKLQNKEDCRIGKVEDWNWNCRVEVAKQEFIVKGAEFEFKNKKDFRIGRIAELKLRLQSWSCRIGVAKLELHT
jgi:hypothetical protein